MREYSVIIVGAGPSGISTAINLTKSGVDGVLVLERSVFPRNKCCAGYITNKTKQAYKNLGLDIDDCNYSLIKDFKIRYRLKDKLVIENKFLYTNKNIDRVELDFAFFKLAKDKGIEILEGATIVSHDVEGRTLTLADGETFKYERLVFADGTTGFGSKYQRCKRKNIAMQLVFPNETDEAIDLHFGITKHGYGWVSSYGGVTNVGLTDVYDKRINYKKIFAEFLGSVGMKADINQLKAAFTPIGINKAVMCGNIFYVGDAVGACDPLTLSGLRYGISSGKYCARAIAQNKNSIYIRYARKLKVKFAFMRLIQKIFYLAPVRFFVFCILCKVFGGLVSAVFNHFFVNKK